MSWLTDFVKPKLRALVRADVPEDLWEKCPNCGQMIFQKELEQRHRVCPHCDHHMRLGARARLDHLFGAGAWEDIALPDVPLDPLKFRDRQRYGDRLKAAQSKTGLKDAVLVRAGKLGNVPVVAAAFDFGCMGGSMGIAVGEAVVAAARAAVARKAALLVFPSSGGARMQEGILSLMQMPRTVIAVDEVKEAGLPYIVVLTDPTTGGVTASFAMLGDIHVAETGAVIGFAGQRVIAETIREQLPPDFQRAEYLRDHGMVDLVVHREKLVETLSRLVDLLMNRLPKQEALPAPEATEPDPTADAEAIVPVDVPSEPTGKKTD